MKKNVLIDATTVTSQVDGLSIYIINLIRHLPLHAFEIFSFDILINPGFTRSDLEPILQSGKFRILRKRIAPIGPKRDWDMFWFLRKHRKGYDVIHITSNQYPLSLKNGISTIHDITFKRFFDHPKYSFNMATWYMDKVIRGCLRRSRRVIAVSKATKYELIAQYSLGREQSEKIDVIHEGWEHLQVQPDGYCDNKKDWKNCIFYIGTARKHKNIHNLLLAFRIAITKLDADIKLVIAGSNKYINEKDRQIISEINSSGDRVVLTGYLSDACVNELFTKADAFIFPSLSEGFGLPLLEAFYHNIPVLSSDVTSLPEVAGDAALYFNPSDPNDIAGKIVQFYEQPEIRKRLTAAGKERLLHFSWVQAAEETVEVYKQSLNITG